jgi:hypothetical protein
MAQSETPPPICCNEALPEGPEGAAPASQAVGEVGPRISISDEGLDTMGLSRSHFIVLIASTFFHGDAVDVLVPKTYSVDPLVFESSPELGKGRFESDRPAEEVLVAVQVRSFYRLHLLQLNSEDVDQLGRFYLTDGEITVEVNFQPEESAQDR